MTLNHCCRFDYLEKIFTTDTVEFLRKLSLPDDIIQLILNFVPDTDQKYWHWHCMSIINDPKRIIQVNHSRILKTGMWFQITKRSLVIDHLQWVADDEFNNGSEIIGSKLIYAKKLFRKLKPRSVYFREQGNFDDFVMIEEYKITYNEDIKEIINYPQIDEYWNLIRFLFQ